MKMVGEGFGSPPPLIRERVKLVNEPGGHIFDAVSAVVVAGVFAKIIPVIAAALSIVWYTIRLIDYCKSRKHNKNT